MTGSPAVAAAVVVDSGRVLLIRRASPEGPLVWSFPGGKVGPGECPPAAAVREALEEAGVVVESLRLLGERVHPGTGRQMVYVACRLLAGEVHAASVREVAELAWVGAAELRRLVPGGVYGPVREYLDGLIGE